jgi:dethiobiotin synthetase
MGSLPPAKRGKEGDSAWGKLFLVGTRCQSYILNQRMPSFFITGTDTGVGKTYFTSWLARSWCTAGHSAAALKPVCTGDRSDAEILRTAAGFGLSLDEINPHHFAAAAAPFVAAREEGRVIDFIAENRRILDFQARFTHLAVEGAGGWRVPVAPGYEVRDWARDLGLPVVVVARATLGTINHTLLTVENIRASGAVCAGVVVNAGAVPAEAKNSPDFELVRRTNLDLLHDLLLLPILEFDRRVERAGQVPLWLGGEKI